MLILTSYARRSRMTDGFEVIVVIDRMKSRSDRRFQHRTESKAGVTAPALIALRALFHRAEHDMMKDYIINSSTILLRLQRQVPRISNRGPTASSLFSSIITPNPTTILDPIHNPSNPLSESLRTFRPSNYDFQEIPLYRPIHILHIFANELILELLPSPRLNGQVPTLIHHQPTLFPLSANDICTCRRPPSAKTTICKKITDQKFRVDSPVIFVPPPRIELGIFASRGYKCDALPLRHGGPLKGPGSR